jgi:thiol-disulfide isomerase/thioredoxin
MMNSEKKSRPHPGLFGALILLVLLTGIVVILLERKGSQIESISDSASAIPIETANNAVPTYRYPTNTGISPASQYKFAIANGKPTLVFFHSYTCKSCLQMIDTVYEIYPEFSSQVVLIDVDVHDIRNEALLHRVGINLIPTLIFYNQAGDSMFSVGVISGEELRQRLIELCQGKVP